MPDRAVITMPDDIKNAKGELGPICNKCSGFGFTYSIKGKHLDCKECHETGVSVNVVDLQQQVIALTRLVKLLYKEMQDNNLTNVK